MRYAKQLRERWNNFLNPEIVRIEWTHQEKLTLFHMVESVGKRWSVIAK